MMGRFAAVAAYAVLAGAGLASAAAAQPVQSAAMPMSPPPPSSAVDPGNPAGTPLPAVVSSAPDYKLGSADKVRIIIYNEPTLTGEYLVNANGSISFPLIGDVAASGRTTLQIASEIEAKLANGYLRDPKVSIDVLSFRPFYILGEVNKPGEYPYSAGLTVLNAVATAQGFTYRANKGRVYIKHQDVDKEDVLKLSSDTPVRPGDTIRIGERYF